MRNRIYSKNEEIANTLSHGLGILLGLVGGAILLIAANGNESNWAVGSVIAYLIGMQASYISSTCYHGCVKTHVKQVLRKFDHAAIYLHIAGTYMPFILLILRQEGAWGWTLFTIIILSAIAGLILSFTRLKAHSNLETVCYVLMGCSILIAIVPLYNSLQETGQLAALHWLIAGGVAYIVGALFYSWTKIRFMHTVFHFFVLAGSVCHIVAIYIIL